MKKYVVELDFKMTAEVETAVEDGKEMSEEMIKEKAIEEFFWRSSFRATSKPVRRTDILESRIVDSYEESPDEECETCEVE